MIKPEELNFKRKLIEKEHAGFIKRFKRRPPPGIDQEIKELDEQVFSFTDCTSCANCCKTISPVFKNRDIERLSSHFRLKPGAFTERYLYMDDEGDYVLKSAPCPFLLENNYCSVYDHRPDACRKYPHTASLDITKSWDLFVKNSAACPAVHEILQRIRAKYDK